MEVASDFRSRNLVMGVGRIRAREEDSTELDSGFVEFELQKAERTLHHRSMEMATMVPVFLKLASLKWDDAPKWIAMAKAILDVVEEAYTKQMDGSQEKREMGGAVKSVSWVDETHPTPDSEAKPTTVIENPVVGSDVKSLLEQEGPHEDLCIKESSEKEQQRKTRREIMVVGQQLKSNIAQAAKTAQELVGFLPDFLVVVGAFSALFGSKDSNCSALRKMILLIR
ncbi:hypothetical protein ZIOFF_039872 [Zingiber officinale]|uniref:Uncharacterized protein n=1 Tax=Zingiber officinale TaxID=94328 RepID=A0A8J5G313_ZINOF|nr:hypothetical protein ZIOFF_039872 [Zingiber officinale]